jgi:hypothetical protein
MEEAEEGQAAAEFAALVPVVSGVVDLTLLHWPRWGGGLPDLSACKALTAVELSRWEGWRENSHVGTGQEDFLSMVAPLVQLQRLVVCRMPWLNARVASWLQHMLPQLQLVQLIACGRLLPAAPAGQGQQAAQQQQQQAEEEEQREREVLQQVRQLLRPGLQVEVSR